MRVEDTLRDAFLVAAPTAFPDVRFFYRNIIDRTIQEPRTGRTYQLKSGTPGMADLFGHARASPWAIPIEIELKAWNGTQSKEQKRWMNFCKQMAIPYLLLRQRREESTEQTISRWISEVSRLLSSIRPSTPSTTTPSKRSSTDFPPGEPPIAPTSETPSV